MSNNKEIDTDSIVSILNMDGSDKHSKEKKKIITRTFNKNVQTKANFDGNIQPPKTISTDTNQKQLKNTTMDKNRTGKQSKKRKTISKKSTVIEPTYCICEKVSYGNMVCCDNDVCPIEWFHFNCVSLRKKPKGKWYCPMCRGRNSTKMKSRELCFQELAAYNKLKEEA